MTELEPKFVVIIRCPNCNMLLKQKPKSKFYCKGCKKIIGNNRLKVKYVTRRQSVITEWCSVKKIVDSKKN